MLRKLLRKLLGDSDAIRELDDAREELERISNRDRRESDAYLDANQRVIDAEQNVPWWRR